MSKKIIISYLIGAVVCFVLFAICMTHISEGFSTFIFLGIAGLSGFMVCIMGMVSSLQKSNANKDSTNSVK
ncbi:hypothetical protein CN918_31005 [Priestia megaterium]|nr:hypothetical protein CN918_31005 [Priestia megaterium]